MSAALTMLALGAVNGALLGGTALAVVPIIIHWLSRRRYRRVPWAAMRFLLEAERETRRRVRLEQWLLLALRCLAMALLALLVARPFLQPGLVGTLLGQGGRVQRVLVLDDSASMAGRHDGTTAFDEMTAAAARLVSWVAQEAPDQPLRIYLTSQPRTPWLTADLLDAPTVEDVQARLQALQPTVLRAAPRAVLQTIADELAAQGAFDRTDVYVLADWQRTDWAGDTPEAAVFAPLRQVATGNESLRVLLVDGAETPRDNVAVTDLRLTRPFAVAALPTRVQLELANFGSATSPPARIELNLGTQTLPGLDVPSLSPGERRTREHEITLPQPGATALAARWTADDDLPGDDVFYATPVVREALRVLIVNGQPAADPREDEVYLLRRALAPPGPFSSGVQTTVIDPEELVGADLAAYDVVLLCNVALVNENALGALERFVQSGGGLALFAGSAIRDQALFNRTLGPAGAGLLPAELDGTRDAGDEAVGLVRAAEHDVTAMFPGEADALPESVRFRRYWRLRVRQSDDDAPPRILARFTDAERSPALVEQPVGRGRVLLFASSVDMEWNTWPAATDGSYVVTMLELVQYLAGAPDLPRQFLAGQTLAAAVSPERYAPEVSFRPPNYPEQPAVTAQADEPAGLGDLMVARGPVADALGIYVAELTPRTGGSVVRTLGVNLDPRESDLRPASRDELTAQLAGVPHEFIARAQIATQEGERTRRELWPLILTALVVVLLVEQVLAWWMGRLDRPLRNTTVARG